MTPIKTAHVSGHLDLTKEEFYRYYVPTIDRFLQQAQEQRYTARFIVCDARGADRYFWKFMTMLALEDQVTIYHMFEAPRFGADHTNLVGGFISDTERDAAATAASDLDIAWVRPGREDSGTARNIRRRTQC